MRASWRRYVQGQPEPAQIARPASDGVTQRSNLARLVAPRRARSPPLPVSRPATPVGCPHRLWGSQASQERAVLPLSPHAGATLGLGVPSTRHPSRIGSPRLPVRLISGELKNRRRLPGFALERKQVGDRAELYSVQTERSRIANPSVIAWVARESDTLGWDVEDRSVTPHRCVEVKGRRDGEVIFYLSENEWRRAHELGGRPPSRAGP